MPYIKLPIPDTKSSVSRPVVLDIIQQVIKHTGIDPNIRITYPDYLEREAQIGSRITDSSESGKFSSQQKISIEVDEEFDENSILTSAVYYPENQFIFIDSALDTYIKPSYGKVNLSINFKLRFIDQNAARMWRDEIKTRMTLLRDIILHDVSYHYGIPKEFFVLLKEIHRLRESVAPYNETFDAYFKKMSDDKVSLLTNLSGTQDLYAVSETQSRIQGYFDFSSAPEQGSKENDTDSSTISFTYKTSYDKPLEILMQYPLMIHNQVLSKKFRPTLQDNQTKETQSYRNFSSGNFALFENTNPLFNKNTTGVGIPEIDDFIPNNTLPNTMRVFTALVKLNPLNLNHITKLDQLGQYELLPEVVDFLKEESSYLNKPYQSIFNLAVYRNRSLIDYNLFSVDSNLNVIKNATADLRSYYHVRLSILTDLSLLSRPGKERLKENGCLTKLLLLLIDPSLKDKGLLPDKICQLNYISEEQLNNCIYEINRAIISRGDKQIRQFNTVMSLYIQSHSKS